ncbi:MAG TPA: Fe-S cluster assembly protein SufD [Mycobacteriales bacterium]|nr:Fe-S cluster assembly protein SufD [Mycobacteriales bacterium]
MAVQETAADEAAAVLAARERAARERTALAGQVLGRDVGAAAGPPTTPATGTAVPSGARSGGGHSHGPGSRSGSPPERFTSTNPDAFGRPTGREEDWRFTPLDRLTALLEPFEPDATVVFDAQVPPEVEVRDVAGDDPLVGSVLAPADRVSALALQRVRTARLVTIPKGTVLAEPVWLTLRARAGAGATGLAYEHLVIDAHPFSEAVVVFDHVGSAQLASNLEIRVGDGAALTVVSLQNWDDDAVHLEAQAAQVGRDAKLRHIVVTLGGNLVRITPTVRFTGPGGDAELLGISFADAGQHQEHRLYVDHAVPRCRSRVTYKSALQGEDAHTVWIGDVRIRPGGVQTDTYELNRNLLLTDGARADSVPNLEIETGEVVGAGHASATGRFDDLQLFYLMSRGIPAEEARRLVVRGFFAQVIEQIGVPEVQERLTAAIDAELTQVGS